MFDKKGYTKMENEPNKNEVNAANEWDTLKNYDAIKQTLQDELLNIDDMLNSGSINEEQAERYRKEVNERAEKAKQPQLDPSAQKYLDEENQNIQEMLDSGWIDEEKADRYRKEVSARAEKAAQLAASEHEKDITSAEEKEKLAQKEHEKAIANLGEAAEQNELEKELMGIAMANLDMALDANQIDEEAEADRQKRLEELGAKLDEMRPDLTELYAKNRRLIVFPKTRAEFVKAKGEYAKLLDEYLKLKAESRYETRSAEIAKELQAKFDSLREEIGADFAKSDGEEAENPEEKTAERTRRIKEAVDALKAEWKEKNDGLKVEINAKFLEDFLAQENALEEGTIDKLDNGTACRELVSKVINNKYLKTALIAAGAVGLAVTGVGLAAGLAAGTMTVGLGGFTAGGVAAGIARGGLAGAIMSRQSSANSAIRGFADEEEIKKNLEGIDIISKQGEVNDEATANVADWLLEQYEGAKDSDLKSNRKRTLVAAGIGAAVGALMSGVQVNDITHETVTNQVQTGNNPVEAARLGDVNIPEGHGAYDTFTQLGGNPADYNKFESIMFDIDAKYGLSPGSNGEVAGFDGLVGQFAHTYPGTIDTWPSTAQAYITEVANEAARQGLIPSTGGEAIYNTVTEVVTEQVPNAFMTFLTQVLTAPAVGVIAGGVSSNMQNRTPAAEFQSPASSGEEPAVDESTEETPTNEPEEVPEATSEPEATPEQTEPSSETVSEPETESGSEAAGEAQQSEQEQTTEPSPEIANEDQDFRNRVETALGNLINEEGIDIVSMTRASDEAMADAQASRFEAWWDGLSEDAQNAVRQFESTLDRNSIQGGALRFWLEQKDRLDNQQA